MLASCAYVLSSFVCATPRSTLRNVNETSVEQRVAAGAAWLDEHEPGWERRIDLGVLELADDCRCVLGQLSGRTMDEACLSPFSDYVMEYGPSDTVRFGFNVMVGGSAAAFTALDEAWISLIKSRFDSGTLSDAS